VKIVPLFILILFISVPLIEIGLFIQVGSLIGLWPTLATVVLTAIIGTWLLRQQGFAVIAQARETTARNELPVEPIIHGVFLLVAGLLMLTPGFFTDAIGFLLLVPRIRLGIAYAIWDKIKDNVHVVQPGMRPHPGSPVDRSTGPGVGPIIDGEAIESETKSKPDAGPPRDDSPWRSS
jgi:UPF0716 protein FxsA